MNRLHTLTDGTKEKEHDLSNDCSHLKPGATFYLSLHIGNADGTLDVDMEAPTASTSMPQVIQAAKDVCDSGMDAYVYECRAVRKVVRGAIRVTVLKPK